MNGSKSTWQDEDNGDSPSSVTKTVTKCNCCSSKFNISFNESSPVTESTSNSPLAESEQKRFNDYKQD